MLKSTKTLLAAGLVLGASAFAFTGPALADDEVSLSANVALTTDYRFRGVSLSAEDPAIQGGIDIGYQGFYIGTWSSSIDQFNGSEQEVDLYGGWGMDLTDGLAIDAGFLYYVYPGGVGTDYYELHATVSGSVQMIDWSLGINYNPSQSNLGDEDDTYIHGDLSYTIPDSPVYVGAALGYEDGALSFGGNKWDWSLKLGVTYQQWDVSVAYIDTNKGVADGCSTCGATGVVTVGASF